MIVTDGQRVRLWNDGKEIGPFTVAEIRMHAKRGALKPDALYFDESGGDWKPVESLLAAPKRPVPTEFASPPPAQAPEPLPVGQSRTGLQMVKAQRSYALFIGLGLTGGMLGWHNFYAGHTAFGCAKFFATALGVALTLTVKGNPVPGIVVLCLVALWVFIELATGEADADGDPLR